MFDSCRYDCCLCWVDAWADLCQGLVFCLFVGDGGGELRNNIERKWDGWTYSIVNYSFNGDENPERSRHGEEGTVEVFRC